MALAELEAGRNASTVSIGALMNPVQHHTRVVLGLTTKTSIVLPPFRSPQMHPVQLHSKLTRKDFMLTVTNRRSRKNSEKNKRSGASGHGVRIMPTTRLGSFASGLMAKVSRLYVGIHSITSIATTGHVERFRISSQVKSNGSIR